MIFEITRPYIFSYAFEIFWRWKLLWERITFIRATSSLSVIACILYAWIICNFKTHESLSQMHSCVINLLVEIKYDQSRNYTEVPWQILQDENSVLIAILIFSTFVTQTSSSTPKVKLAVIIKKH